MKNSSKTFGKASFKGERTRRIAIYNSWKGTARSFGGLRMTKMGVGFR
jgi:hypothetical protein